MNNQMQAPPMDYSFYPQKQQDDYNKFMQKMDELITFLILRMSGRVKVLNTLNKFEIKQLTEPMLNEIGINFIETKLRSYLNPNTYMSKLDEKEANQHAEQEIKSFASILRFNMFRYEIKAESIGELISILCPIIIFALKKSVSDKDFVEHTTQNRNTNRAPINPNDPYGLGGPFG